MYFFVSDMKEDQQDKVPLFKSWNYWYTLVIVFLVLQILLFYLFTKTFA